MNLTLLRQPDHLTVMTDDGWTSAGVEVGCEVRNEALRVSMEAAGVGVRWVGLRWSCDVPTGCRVLGDAWERGYGDLAWRGLVPERPLPWYFMLHDGEATFGAGVMTGGAAMAMWRVDDRGITLWLDVRNGGHGVQLGSRRLEAATVRQIASDTERPFIVARRLAESLCPQSRTPAEPVMGFNDWYYCYSHNSREQTLADAERLAGLVPAGGVRPFQVIDDGWQHNHKPNCCAATPVVRGNDKFGDMADLAGAIKRLDVRPGIWVRLLPCDESVPDAWLLPSEHFRGRAAGLPMLDPSVPEVLEHVKRDIATLVGWGYEMIKHDFSTWDLFGRWGFEMGESMPGDADWHFADRSRTSAEIIVDFYRAIREAAGGVSLIGCNTIGHLAAGLVELQRTGDDTSGKTWERTRKMGVNTLAYRMNQHGTFFAADADCVGLTEQVDWRLNRQWLELVAGSGTPLFVSADPAALDEETNAALRDAFAMAAAAPPPAEPLDWLSTTCPSRWVINGLETRFDWHGPAGVRPGDMGV